MTRTNVALRRTPEGRRLLRAARRYKEDSPQRAALALDDWFDKAKARETFATSLATEKRFATQLFKLVKHVADFIMTTFDTQDSQQTDGSSLWEWVNTVSEWAERYSEIVEPWAQAAVVAMHKRIEKANADDWKRMSVLMGRALHEEIANTPLSSVLGQLRSDQINLIKDIPPYLAQRVWNAVYKYTTEGIETSKRYDALVNELRHIGLDRAKAVLIARTETSRTSSVLTEVRAQNAGSPGYRWQCVHDGRARPMHRYLDDLCNRQGKVIPWGLRPECDKGHYSHAGQIWNCRCHEAPVFPLPGEEIVFATADELAYREFLNA